MTAWFLTILLFFAYFYIEYLIYKYSIYKTFLIIYYY